jgi:acetyl-CoA synthetase
VRLIDPETANFDTIYTKFRWAIPDRLNIASQVCERHQSDPYRIAVYYENSDGETAIYSFGQLKTLSDQFANALKGLGVARGDRVAIVLSQRIETVISHLAIYKLGAVALPLAILFGREALEYRLRDSGSKLAITDHSKYATVRAMLTEL